MLKPPNWKSRQRVRRSVDDNVCDEVLELDVIPDRLLSMPRHTSSLSSSHALSSTLRRKTLSRLLSASHISTQKGFSCPRYTRYPASQPIPVTFGPIQFTPTNPEGDGQGTGLNGAKLRGYCLLNRNLNPNPNLDLNLLVEN